MKGQNRASSTDIGLAQKGGRGNCYPNLNQLTENYINLPSSAVIAGLINTCGMSEMLTDVNIYKCHIQYVKSNINKGFLLFS